MIPPSISRFALALVFASQTLSAQASPPPPYRDTSRAIDERVRDLIGRMTLEEKFWQLFMIPGDLDNPANDFSHGVFGLQVGVPASATAATAARAHAERINDIQRYFSERTRLGIPAIPFEEAVHGLAREGATIFPSAIALAATWDSALMGRVASAIARETRSRGIRQVLSPVVNLASDVRWGRVEETYGEDPYLASVMARAFVSSFEKAGIVATPKHFVANVGDGGRDSYPIDMSQRLLEERYFPPFRAALSDAGARSVMTAYNSVNGSPSTQNQALLTDQLKREWHFGGFVISDAAATGGATVLHMTEANTAAATRDAFESGLDVVFQSSWDQHRPYLDAFRRGLIADSLIDASLTRVLRAKFELGIFEQPLVNVDSASYWNGHKNHRDLAREAARASIVLLRNERHALPLRRSLRSIAVIGTDATESRLGGYSGPGIHPVSILTGLREALGASTAFRYAPGPGRIVSDLVTIPAEYFAPSSGERDSRGLRAEYFDNPFLRGAPLIVRRDDAVDFRWRFNSPGAGIPVDWYSARWTGVLRVPAGGVRRLGVEGDDGYRLWVDGHLAVDNWVKRSYGRRTVELSLAGGTTHTIRLEYFESSGNARLKLVWDAGLRRDWQTKIDHAVAAARRSEVAVIVAGLEEGEFRDRASLALPGRQEEMIRRVAASGTPVIVVLVGGSAVTMRSWIDEVQGVLEIWYPGEEGGRAVADVLLGSYNPAGRLPITFPMAEGQLPLIYNHKPTGRGDDYVDLSGKPLFPFGYGLSFTSFEYSGLQIEPAEMTADGAAIVRCKVRNTGAREGDEVVQLYIRDVLASVARPVLSLEGFARVRLAPGEEKEVSFRLSQEHLRMLDKEMRWIVEPGLFRVLVGASSRDIRLRGDLVVR